MQPECSDSGVGSFRESGIIIIIIRLKNKSGTNTAGSTVAWRTNPHVCVIERLHRRDGVVLKSVRFAVDRSGVHVPSRVIPTDFKKR